MFSNELYDISMSGFRLSDTYYVPRTELDLPQPINSRESVDVQRVDDVGFRRTAIWEVSHGRHGRVVAEHRELGEEDERGLCS